MYGPSNPLLIKLAKHMHASHGIMISFNFLNDSYQDKLIYHARACIDALRDYHDNMNAEAEALGHAYISYDDIIKNALKVYK